MVYTKQNRAEKKLYRLHQLTSAHYSCCWTEHLPCQCLECGGSQTLHDCCDTDSQRWRGTQLWDLALGGTNLWEFLWTGRPYTT